MLCNCGGKRYIIGNIKGCPCSTSTNTVARHRSAGAAGSEPDPDRFGDRALARVPIVFPEPRIYRWRLFHTGWFARRNDEPYSGSFAVRRLQCRQATPTPLFVLASCNWRRSATQSAEDAVVADCALSLDDGRHQIRQLVACRKQAFSTTCRRRSIGKISRISRWPIRRCEPSRTVSSSTASASPQQARCRPST